MEWDTRTRNEVVLLADHIGSTCSSNNGNTHDGNDYAKSLTLDVPVSCLGSAFIS